MIGLALGLALLGPEEPPVESDAGPPTVGEQDPEAEPPGPLVEEQEQEQDEEEQEQGQEQEQEQEPVIREATEKDAKAGAIGGKGYVPLPAAAKKSDGKIAKGPWRGSGWFELRIDFVAPVGGKKPARGNVFTGAGGLWAGWRLHPLVGLHGGVTTFIHDNDRRTVFDESLAEDVEVSEFGRMTLFDLAVIRAFIPTPRRIQPYFDVGGFIGAYRAPFSARARASGGARFGVGVDFWLGQTFTLSVSFDERMIVVGRNIGHTLQTGVAAGLHF